jgi:hypothetical protein
MATTHCVSVQLDMNVLSTYASSNEPNNIAHEPILTTNQSMSFISRLSRLLSSTFGTSNTVVYKTVDAYNNV